VQPYLTRFLDAYRPQAVQALKAELGRRGRWDGQTAYNMDVRLAKRGQLYAQNLSLNLRYVLPNNWVTFSMTTPTVFGSSLDPRFTVTFDLVLTVSVSNALQATGVQVQVQNAHIQGANLIGDLATAVNDFLHFLGGSDFRKALEGQIDAQTQMLPLNVGLRDLGLAIPAGLTCRPFLDAQGRTLTLLIPAAPPGPPPILH
jgi:hypothetical protein